MMLGQDKSIQLEERLIDFAVRIIKLGESLPKTPTGKHLAGQITRSGTSPAPNYGEARGAESYVDFVHKLGVVLKELNETSIWLRIIQKAELVKPERLQPLLRECGELCRFLTASTTTAKRKLKDARQNK